MLSTTILNIAMPNPCCENWLFLRLITYIKQLCQFINSFASFGRPSPRSLFAQNRPNMKR
ncbi:hypothetical protein SAMN05216489_02746 [Streptomyces sp. 3213]|nr:hypothetical protein SAMN05216489_02746 [Streptomyces sp. 3213] [Streptomyces sp. 3213.3]